jgi:2-keto-3-deoxy-L-rhamnonate aldolase RhmA
MKSLKASLATGDVLLGSFIMTGNCAAIELSGHLGFDFVVIDCEHGVVSPFGQELLDLIRAAYAADIPAFVRVIENDLSQIRKALDFGAKGVIVPLINSEEDAQRMVDVCLYPPDGSRGRCPIVPAARFGVSDWTQFRRVSNDELILMPIIETVQAVEHVEKILSVVGISGVLYGPVDLAGELGVEMGHPKLQEYSGHIKSACEKSKKLFANLAWSVESAVQMANAGSQLVAVTDITMFTEAAKRYLDSVKKRSR